MKTIEKLAIALIIAWGIQMVSTPVWMNFVLTRMSAGDNDSYAILTSALASAAVIGSYSTAVICGLWLYTESRRHSQARWIWTVLGLIFQLKALPVFYGYVILNQIMLSEKSSEHSAPLVSGTRGTPPAKAGAAPQVPNGEP